MSKELKRKITLLRVVFYILISMLFFLLGFSTSNRRFSNKKNRNGVILELEINSNESKQDSSIYMVRSIQ